MPGGLLTLGPVVKHGARAAGLFFFFFFFFGVIGDVLLIVMIA